MVEIIERNKANFLEAKNAFNEKRLDDCVRFYAPNHEIKSKKSVQSREGIRQFLEGLHETWSDVRITVEHIVAEENRLMALSRATAKHTKTVLGVEPTGKTIETTFWELHHFDDEGLITESWNMIDNLAIMRQLGIIPE
jgi:steroid delta-isomerase-like uncharacterized protein